MNKRDVIKMFYNQSQVCYGKGFEIFEEVYEELKDKLDLIKEDKGSYVIVRPRKSKVEQIKEILEV